MEITTRPRLLHFGWLAIGLVALVTAGALIITRENLALGLAAMVLAVASIAKAYQHGKAAGNFDMAFFYYSCAAAALSLIVLVFEVIRHANSSFVALAAANLATAAVAAYRAYRLHRDGSKRE